jgi:hypothetical protein
MQIGKNLRRTGLEGANTNTQSARNENDFKMTEDEKSIFE